MAENCSNYINTFAPTFEKICIQIDNELSGLNHLIVRIRKKDFQRAIIDYKPKH